MRLAGKVAIVTGSTQGIGRAIARRFATEGASVVVAGRNQAKGQAVEKEIREAGGIAAYVQTDIRLEDQAERMVSFGLERYGQIDILVNNAGVNVARGKPFFELTKEEWYATMETNLTGMFFCSRAAARHMIQRKQGKIVNIASVFSYCAASGDAAYATSKGGVIQLTRSMAVDLCPYNISVNSIAPGAIAVERPPGSVRGPMHDYILMGRFGTADEVASLALFLASDDSSYINGETITIDGGLLTLLPGKPIGTP